MNNEFLRQLPPEDQSVSDVLQSKAQSIQVNPQFQSNLEARLKQAHPEKTPPAQGFQIKLLPAIGWAILAIGAFMVLNWAVRSLAPELQPATNGTPVPDTSFETNINAGNICAGQLAVAHGFSVFLTNHDKSGFVTLDEEKSIGELRTFVWSPDGKRLAVLGNTRGSGNLYLTDSTGDALQPVVQNSQFGYLAGVSWARGGDRLLTWEISNNTRMILVDLDGTGAAVVNLPLHSIETPQFAPDDKSILFHGGDATSYGLFRVTIDGSSQVSRISGLVEDETSFAWSPDGSRLAFIEMDRDLGEARLVVESDGSKNTIATLPIPAGSGSSIPSSANLSWSPDGTGLVFEFGRNVSDRVIYLAKLDGSGLVQLAEAAHAPAISPDGKCLAYISNDRVFLLDLAKSTAAVTATEPVLLAELPAGRGSANFQLDKLGWGRNTASIIDVPDNNATPTPTSIPSETGYDWRGIKLYLDASLPDAPDQAGIFEIQPEQPATLDSARALAEQFGMRGNVYEAPSVIGNSDTTDFIVEDRNQRLLVRSNLFFSYYPDYTRWATGSGFGQVPDQAAAEEMIAAFLRTHGFDFAYKVDLSEFFTGYYALPLTPDGFSIHNEHFQLAGFLFRFDEAGIIAVEASLMDYVPIETFGIIPAETALQKLLDPATVYGIREGAHSANPYVKTWYRPRPENETVTIWGWMSSVEAVESGGSPLVTFDGYRATGNLAGLAEATPNTFVEATGQIQTIDGIKTFAVESWQVYTGYEEGLQGTIQRTGDQTTITTLDGATLTLPDAPADLSLPIENAFVLGVTRGDVFEWKSIDTRMQGGGGGGGGGGSGFYKPNLTGTPVPLPTLESPRESNTEPVGYIVKEGDTLTAIAESFGITADELMQANGLGEATIFIGQSLIIPGAETGPEQPLLGQAIEGQRGTLTVTIVKQGDGAQRVKYNFEIIDEERYLYMRLEGEDLDALQDYHNRPVKIWGTINDFSIEFGAEIPVLNVERYEVLYPEQQFQILKGTQSIMDVEGKSITLLTTDDGQTYAQPASFSGLIGNEGDQVLMEALVIPDETIAGYPLLHVVSASIAVNPENGQPVELQITADRPYIMEETEQPEPPADLTATIESVELVYFTPNQRYKPADPASDPVYIQPVWRFQGHYWDGSEFEILVQALKDEFLLPEIEPIEPPG